MKKWVTPIFKLLNSERRNFYAKSVDNILHYQLDFFVCKKIKQMLNA